MTREELTHRLSLLRRARIGGSRAPHKPLLVLWLLGRFAETGSTEVSYEMAEEPVSRLINDFGPAVRSPAAARQRAAMPFVHLERELWDLRDKDGEEIGPGAPERRGWLRDRGAHGRLRPEVELLLTEPGMLGQAVRLLMEQHFTTALETVICDAIGLDPAGLAEPAELPATRRRRRRTAFTEEVLQAYAYACAFCGFDGALGRNPVGLEAAHVRWHSQDGPDEFGNGLALCSLHHTLFDVGVLGILPDLRIQVSPLYVARSAAARATDMLHGQPVALPRPGRPRPEPEHVDWHARQVFKGAGAAAA
ncbi:phosphorothioated DNA-binding restriction endonuclease [Streptomyces sp. NPDC002734]|uniref:phosphorothioated DNA-binding restriction endonuclease n=1 Tax=Streptomyces sp. NPDC002734 TaxID=3154426 RepID=UPI00332F2181